LRSVGSPELFFGQPSQIIPFDLMAFASFGNLDSKLLARSTKQIIRSWPPPSRRLFFTPGKLAQFVLKTVWLV
jgi:hypothetical protein